MMNTSKTLNIEQPPWEDTVEYSTIKNSEMFWPFFNHKDDSVLNALDAKIAAADERIAAKQTLLNQLTEECAQAQKEVEELQKQVNSWEKAINKKKN